jgi:hypothetical protein
MSRYDVRVGDATIAVSPIEPPAAIDRACELMRVALVDETTGAPPLGAVTARLTAPAARASVRVAHPGLIGVAGRPGAAFASRLATNGWVEIDIAAPRYAPRRLSVVFACKLRRLASSAAGAALTLDSSAGVEPGQRILVGRVDGTLAEIGLVATVGPGAGQVTLRQALGFPYPAGSPVQPLPADQEIELRRRRVSVVGRILLRAGAATAPLAGARVRVSKLWRRIPPAGVVAPPDPPDPGAPAPAPPWDAPIAGLSPPAYVDLAAGAIELEDRAVDAGVTAKALLDDVPAGARRLRLSSATGLGAADIVAVEADDDARREILEIRAIVPAGGPADWAQVTLTHPLAFTHGRGRLVRRLAPPAAVVSRALNYGVAGGDEAVLFDATGLAGRRQVRLIDPGPPLAQSFHTIDVLAATSDADGFYRMPPIARAGKIEIFAQDAGSAAHAAVEVVLDYDQPEHRVDVTVS